MTMNKESRESQALLVDVDADNPDMSAITLPEWLRNILPSVKTPYMVDYNVNQSTYVIKNPSREIASEHDTLVDAYEAAHDLNSQDEDSGGLDITDSVPEVRDNKFGRKMLSVPTENSNFLRALMFITDAERLDMLKYDYYSWLRNSLVDFENDPEGFLTSYYFLDGHPCFWTHDNILGSDDFTFSWKTEGHVLDIWHHPTLDDNGNLVFRMETGDHVEPDYTSHYHDLRLDVYSDSYENAIIEMAAKVHKFFAPDGSERENVEYEKSDLELTLEEQAKELEEYDKS